MKQLINPPLNLVFTLMALLFLGLTAWSIVSLKLMNEDNQGSGIHTKIEIPSAEALAVPPLRQYKAMIETPLFWESREKYVPPVAEKKPAQQEIALVDKKLPEGRLVGIIDTGESMMAVFKDKDSTQYLHTNDKWGSWKISNIGHDSIELALGGETKSLDLISDYTAPAPNKSLLARRNARQVPNRTGKSNNFAAIRRPNLPSNVQGLPHLAATQKQAPPTALPAEMSIKEALAVRQRLMAARWKRKTH